MVAENKPLVSVIVPIFNSMKFIQSTINSVLNQNYDNLELILVNDGSSDGTKEFLDNLIGNPKIKILHQNNQGYPTALINGINISKGLYISRMDSTDLLDKNKLAKQVQILEDFKEIPFVGTMRYRITESNVIFSPIVELNKVQVNHYEPILWESLILGKREFADPSVMFRRTIYDQVGGYKRYLKSGMDVDLWLRFLEYSENHFGLCIMENLYYHRVELNSIMRNASTKLNNSQVRLMAIERNVNNNSIKNINKLIKSIDEIKNDNNSQLNNYLSTLATFIYLWDFKSFYRSLQISKLPKFISIDFFFSFIFLLKQIFYKRKLIKRIGKI
jgi:glycosyltransferase involved in cell wall biosynthesis